jgi:uncharacterized membrane protein
MYKISLIIMSIFYIAAGTNHFVNPRAYFKLMPAYLPAHETLNYTAGIAEIVGGILLFFPVTRSLAAWGIMAMLIAFLPAHIYMIQEAPIKLGSIIITPFIAWIRIPLQFVLIYWAYQFTK